MLNWPLGAPLPDRVWLGWRAGEVAGPAADSCTPVALSPLGSLGPRSPWLQRPLPPPWRCQPLSPALPARQGRAGRRERRGLGGHPSPWGPLQVGGKCCSVGRDVEGVRNGVPSSGVVWPRPCFQVVMDSGLGPPPAGVGVARATVRLARDTGA